MLLKVRAWDKEKKKMDYSPRAIWEDGDINWNLKNDDFIWMLSSGRNDKNKKEAYEGDIYNCGYKYSDGSHKYGDKNVILDIRNFHPEDEFEIIGNIHDNPELL